MAAPVILGLLLVLLLLAALPGLGGDGAPREPQPREPAVLEPTQDQEREQAVPPAPPGLQDVPLEELVEALREARRPHGGRPALEAELEQVVTAPQLARPARGRGRLWFAPPDRLRIEIASPRRSCLILRQGAFASFRGEEMEKVGEGAAAEISRELTGLLGLAEDPSGLLEMAGRRRIEARMGGGRAEVVLRPSRPGERLLDRFLWISMDVDLEAGAPRSLVLAQGEGDRTEYRLSGVRRHGALPGEWFDTERYVPVEDR